jgi:hypothetical protein
VQVFRHACTLAGAAATSSTDGPTAGSTEMSERPTPTASVRGPPARPPVTTNPGWRTGPLTDSWRDEVARPDHDPGELGRRDARLLIDLSTVMLNHVRDYLPDDLTKEVDRRLGGLTGLRGERGRAQGRGQRSRPDPVTAAYARGGGR